MANARRSGTTKRRGASDRPADGEGPQRAGGVLRRNALAVLCVLLLSSLVGAFFMQTNGPHRIEDQAEASEQRGLSLTCWFLAVTGIAGTFLAGHGVSWGWLILLGLQPLWAVYGIVTHQYGFIASALAYAMAQLHGFVRTAVAPAATGPTPRSAGGGDGGCGARWSARCLKAMIFISAPQKGHNKGSIS